jgi:hypothetical protein
MISIPCNCGQYRDPRETPYNYSHGERLLVLEIVTAKGKERGQL